MEVVRASVRLGWRVSVRISVRLWSRISVRMSVRSFEGRLVYGRRKALKGAGKGAVRDNNYAEEDGDAGSDCDEDEG